MLTLGRQTENFSERKTDRQTETEREKERQEKQTDRQKQRWKKKEREIKFISMCHCIQMTQNYFLNQ